MLRALFEWRDAHPASEPEVEYPSSSARSACESRIYGAYPFAASPDEYPGGGLIVELNVPGLKEGQSPDVLVDGNPVPVVDDFDGGDDGLSFGQIYIAAPIGAHRATIVVEAYFGPVRTTIDLPTVTIASGSGSPTTTSPTTEPS